MVGSARDSDKAADFTENNLSSLDAFPKNLLREEDSEAGMELLHKTKDDVEGARHPAFTGDGGHGDEEHSGARMELRKQVRALSRHVGGLF